ncbi:MAG: hypothetical protein MZU97_22975 [Bacillus subtilis]|nr:hypothetical protein [Bacillus subtilis]
MLDDHRRRPSIQYLSRTSKMRRIQGSAIAEVEEVHRRRFVEVQRVIPIILAK